MNFDKLPIPKKQWPEDVFIAAVKASQSIRDLSLKLGITDRSYSIRWHIVKYNADISHFGWAPRQTFEQFIKNYFEKLKKTTRKDKEDRQNNKNPEKFILRDSRNSDSKRGLINNLTIEKIVKLIANGCQYCKEVNLRMTLDRIDNNKAHNEDNVIPSCIDATI